MEDSTYNKIMKQMRKAGVKDFRWYDGSHYVTNSKDESFVKEASAYINRPKITFNEEKDGSRITTLLQSTIGGRPGGIQLGYKWLGYTFENGKQLTVYDVIKDNTIFTNYKKDLVDYVHETIVNSNTMPEQYLWCDKKRAAASNSLWIAKIFKGWDFSSVYGRWCICHF